MSGVDVLGWWCWAWVMSRVKSLLPLVGRAHTFTQALVLRYHRFAALYHRFAAPAAAKNGVKAS